MLALAKDDALDLELSGSPALLSAGESVFSDPQQVVEGNVAEMPCGSGLGICCCGVGMGCQEVGNSNWHCKLAPCRWVLPAVPLYLLGEALPVASDLAVGVVGGIGLSSQFEGRPDSSKRNLHCRSADAMPSSESSRTDF